MTGLAWNKAWKIRRVLPGWLRKRLVAAFDRHFGRNGRHRTPGRTA